MSVSLLAVAALLAGLLLNRSQSRQPSPTPEFDTDNGVADAYQLEALRRAGI